MLVAIGLDQKSATVADRERLAIPKGHRPAFARALAVLEGVSEVVFLETCCRVEVHAEAIDPDLAARALRGAFAARGGPDLPLFELRGEEALRHLVRVAVGLESAILGEPQILGQVKEAQALSASSGACGRALSTLFNRVYRVAKRVRTETAIGRSGVSWGSAVATLAAKVLGGVAGRRAMVLGAGQMAQLSAQHLADEGAEVVVLNRTFANAEALAARVGGAALPLEELADELLAVDVVVSAAPAAPAAFATDAMAAMMRARRHRPLVLVDLAMPRAIPPGLAKVDGVYVGDVDDLARVLELAKHERDATVAHAERIIDDGIRAYARERAERRAAPVIAALRTRAAAMAAEEVERTLKHLGEDPELKHRLDALASAIVSKVLHAPSARLRQAGANGAPGERLVAAAVEIFDLRSG